LRHYSTLFLWNLQGIAMWGFGELWQGCIDIYFGRYLFPFDDLKARKRGCLRMFQIENVVRRWEGA